MVAKNVLESIDSLPADNDIMELSLLVSRRQFDALQQRARADGMSVGQFLRQLVHQSITPEASVGRSE